MDCSDAGSALTAAPRDESKLALQEMSRSASVAKFVPLLRSLNLGLKALGLVPIRLVPNPGSCAAR